MDKSMQQFEEWFNNGYACSKLDEKLIKAIENVLWDVWKASRESLINNLEPVGYAAEIDINEIEIYGQLFLNEDPTEETNIPLYRLD